MAMITDSSSRCHPCRIGYELPQRVRGGLLSVGLTSLLAGLGTTLPNITYSQNNGLIALTRCASRMAGVACAGWLIIFGVLAKVRRSAG